MTPAQARLLHFVWNVRMGVVESAPPRIAFCLGAILSTMYRPILFCDSPPLIWILGTGVLSMPPATGESADLDQGYLVPPFVYGDDYRARHEQPGGESIREPGEAEPVRFFVIVVPIRFCGGVVMRRTCTLLLAKTGPRLAAVLGRN